MLRCLIIVALLVMSITIIMGRDLYKNHKLTKVALTFAYSGLALSMIAAIAEVIIDLFF